jgi:hypothetical protein
MKRLQTVGLTAVAAGTMTLLAPTLVDAQTNPQTDQQTNPYQTNPPPAPPTPYEPAPVVQVTGPENKPMYTDFGLGVLIGGAVGSFTNSFWEGITDTQGGWTARLVWGTRRLVAVETAYIGSAQEIHAPGLGSNAILLSNGAEGDFRLNLTHGMFQPYLFAGAAWRHYQITNTGANTSALSTHKDIMEIPLGAGLGMNVSGFILDARFAYRPALFDNMLTNTTLGINGITINTSMTAVEAGLRLGFEF